MSTLFQNIALPVNLLDEQAFEANRLGQVTAFQQKQFSSNIGWAKMIGLLFIMVVLAAIFIFVFSSALSGGKSYTSLLPALVIGLVFLMLILFFGNGIFQQLRKNAKFKHDLANGAIRLGQGQLLYKKNGYVFDLGNEITLPMPANQANGLQPGTIYQIYYLEESRYPLSAKVARPATDLQMTTALNDILASVHRFSAEDLLANRQGEVTWAQRQKRFSSLLLGIGIMFGSLCFFIPFVIFPLSSKNSSVFSVIFILVLLGIFPVLGAIMSIKALLDIFMPKLLTIQGVAFKGYRVVITGKSSHIEYYYSINNQRFTINYKAYTALIDGLEYRIYYLARSHKLISIETLNMPNQHF